MSFEVYQYSIRQLKELLVRYSLSSKDRYFEERLDAFFEGKEYINYFEFLFDKLNAKTLVLETNYIDRDFLEDFAEYYVLCFEGYPRDCLRLHLFAFEFSNNDLEECLSGGNDSFSFSGKLSDFYLGFIVVRPLPKTIIGKTCLKHWIAENNKDNVYITHTYSVSLFGIPLEIETLAFQEQDHVTAACATSALWSVFQKTGRLFHHPLPSPAKITRNASKVSPQESRAFPTSGLTPTQIAHAIRSVNLEPWRRGAQNQYYLKGSIYAYLKCQIPVLLGFSVPDTTEGSPDGRHIVAVTGCGIADKKPEPYVANSKNKFLLRASCVDTLYVHDDQFGPYASIYFDSGVKNGSANYSLRIWSIANKNSDSRVAYPDTITIPLYHKIRIPFHFILNKIILFDSIISTFRDALDVEWDIYLTSVNDFKSSIFRASNDGSQNHISSGELRQSILSEPLPRFLWRATAYDQENILLDILFDATSLEQGQLFRFAAEYDLAFSVILHGGFQELNLKDKEVNSLEWKLLEWFMKPSPYKESLYT